MKYSSYTQKIAGEGAEAWNIHNRAVEMAEQGEDIILLSMGDPDFDTPAAIVQSAIKHMKDGKTHYTSFTGEFALRDVIAKQQNAQNDSTLSADNVVILAGAQCALYCALHCIAEFGDEVIVPEPAYVTYEAVIKASGAKIVTVPMSRDENFQVSVSKIEKAITNKTKAILLNAPHNPSGSLIEENELIEIAKLAIEHDLWVVSDEVYASLIFEGKHKSIASIKGMQERTIVINSLSKSHAMSGWRIGWVTGPIELCGHLANMSTCMLYGCPPFSQFAAVTALTEKMEEVALMNSEYKARRDLVVEEFKSIPLLNCYRPDAGMFVMVDVRKTNLSGETFSAKLLDEQGVSVLAGEAFGESSAGHIRIGLVSEQDVLKEACLRIKNFVERLQS